MLLYCYKHYKSALYAQLRNNCILYCISDIYFLINWIKEPDLFDVVHSKSVVPPDDMNILDIIPGVVCKVAYSGQFYQAKVIAVGWLQQLFTVK